MMIVFLGFYTVQWDLFDPTFRMIVMYLFQGCSTPPQKKLPYEQRTQKFENWGIALTCSQENNNAKTGMYKFLQKSSSRVKILGDRTVTRSKTIRKAHKYWAWCQGFVHTSATRQMLLIDCRINVPSRSTSTFVFGDAFRYASHMNVIVTWITIMKCCKNNYKLQAFQAKNVLTEKR